MLPLRFVVFNKLSVCLKFLLSQCPHLFIHFILNLDLNNAFKWERRKSSDDVTDGSSITLLRTSIAKSLKERSQSEVSENEFILLYFLTIYSIHEWQQPRR